MAGRGPAPKAPTDRRRRNAPQLGEWTAATSSGWQHGALPAPPDGLVPATRDAWEAWFGSWVAAHWGPEDLPGLRVVIALYDAVMRGHLARAPELRAWLDSYGITPAGRQARRWSPPTAAEPSRPVTPTRYAHLRAVPAEEGDAG